MWLRVVCDWSRKSKCVISQAPTASLTTASRHARFQWLYRSSCVAASRTPRAAVVPCLLLRLSLGGCIRWATYLSCFSDAVSASMIPAQSYRLKSQLFLCIRKPRPPDALTKIPQQKHRPGSGAKTQHAATLASLLHPRLQGRPFQTGTRRRGDGRLTFVSTTTTPSNQQGNDNTFRDFPEVLFDILSLPYRPIGNLSC